MDKYHAQRQRNQGLLTAAEQRRLRQACVAIAGVGGVGGRIATQLARLGVGHIRLADPDIFTETNLNRQEGAYHSTLGQNKAEVISRLCRDIDPAIQLEVYPEGITAANVEQFTADATLVVDATDFQLPHLGVMLARSARHQRIPLVMGVEIAYGAALCWFDPTGQTYEQYLGLSPEVDPADIAAGRAQVDLLAFVPHIPQYADLAALQQLRAGQIEAPVIAPAVDICAGMAVTLITQLLTGAHVVAPAPYVVQYDAREARAHHVRWRRLHQYWSLARATFRRQR